MRRPWAATAGGCPVGSRRQVGTALLIVVLAAGWPSTASWRDQDTAPTTSAPGRIRHRTAGKDHQEPRLDCQEGDPAPDRGTGSGGTG